MSKVVSSIKSIIVSGYYGFGNCGDEAILMAMLQEFSKFISKDKIIILSNEPEKTKSLYKVHSIYRLDIFRILTRLRKADVFISGGGGLLQDVSGKGFSVLYYLALIVIARYFNTKTVVYGQGIGPIKKTINKNLIRLVLKNVDLIIVRDEKSKIFLEKLSILKKKIVVNADSAFLIKKRELSENIKKKYGLEVNSIGFPFPDNPLIGIVIRNCNAIKLDYDKKIMQFAEIADHLIEKYNFDVVFIPFQIKKDILLIKDIVSKMKYSNAKIIEEELAPDEMLSLISKLTILLGMRLHSIIFATIVNVPFIAIDYDPKVKNYVYSLDLPDLLVKINQLTINNFDYKLKYINIHKKTICSKLKLKSKQFEQEAITNVHLLQKFIKENVIERK